MTFHVLEATPDKSSLLPLFAPSAHRVCRLVAATVAAAFALPLPELRAPTRRSRSAAFARQIAMYVAHVGFGLSFTQVGRGFGRDRTTAAHACKAIEALRDDPRLDRMLEALEHACRRRVGAWPEEPLCGARR
ncbi:MAG TPA: helix-turn-helix domain-containing protein [Xanthobacteraceae bacterium]|nr:helix-turn-helix domain-containing protein [Xanthobacteraceae bacterium]